MDVFDCYRAGGTAAEPTTSSAFGNAHTHFLPARERVPSGRHRQLPDLPGAEPVRRDRQAEDLETDDLEWIGIRDRPVEHDVLTVGGPPCRQELSGRRQLRFDPGAE